jgi:hypothetical protein
MKCAPLQADSRADPFDLARALKSLDSPKLELDLGQEGIV